MRKSISVLVLLALLLSIICIQVYAEPDMSANNTDAQNAMIFGKVYSFDEDTDYTFSTSTEYESSETAAPYGTFLISALSGPLVNQGMKNGVPAFSVSDGSIAIRYTYSDELLTAPEEERHLVADDDDDVDIFELEEDIEKGAIILQRSTDHKNWNDVVVQTNAFEIAPIQADSMYTTTEPEMSNGCYYRLIVVYKTALKGDPTKILGIFSKDTYSYMRTAEIYEFYAALENVYKETLQPDPEGYKFSEPIKVSDGDSYSGQEAIKNGDLHYGWKLGQFNISGFTKKIEEDGKLVFLKNVGDEVTLWFELKQNIDNRLLEG